MFRKILTGLLATTLLTTPAFAQNGTSGSPRVQGVPAGYGDPVQVTIRNTDGSAPGAMGSVTVSSSALPTGAATSAAQTTAATSAGAPGDTACTTDTASCSANAQRQRLAQRLTTINTTLGTPFQAGGSIANTSFAATQSGTWNITNVSGTVSLPTGASTSSLQSTGNTSLSTIASRLPSVLGQTTGANSLSVVLASDTVGTAGSPATTVVSVQGVTSGTPQNVAGAVASGASDSGNPVKVGGRYNATLPTLTDGQRGDLQVGTRGSLGTTLFTQDSTSAIGSATTNADAAGSLNALAVKAFGAVWNGTTWDRASGNTVAASVLPGLSSTFWAYSSGASPILSNTTTAVTIKAAAGASVRNYITSCQITTTAFATSVPLVIRDGAAGTVIWALTVPTAGFLQPVTITFPAPLRGTANTLTEVTTTTANTTGTVTLSCQGFTGA